jgi:hypothetical protein
VRLLFLAQALAQAELAQRSAEVGRIRRHGALYTAPRRGQSTAGGRVLLSLSTVVKRVD